MAKLTGNCQIFEVGKEAWDLWWAKANTNKGGRAGSRNDVEGPAGGKPEGMKAAVLR